MILKTNLRSLILLALIKDIPTINEKPIQEKTIKNVTMIISCTTTPSIVKKQVKWSITYTVMIITPIYSIL